MRFLALVAMASAALAQTEFDVASVKPLATFVPGSNSEKIIAHPGRLTMHSVRLRTCIRWAYDVKDFQVTGPAWMGRIEMSGPNIDRFDIEAEAAEGTPVPEMKRMLQRLLAERFRLAVHRESKVVQGFALLIARPSAALKPSEDQTGPMRMAATPSEMAFFSTTMADFGEYLASRLLVPVIDQTGLEGRFDLTMRWPPELSKEDYVALLPEMARNQFGLELKGRRERVEFLVIDHAEKKPVQD